MKKLLASILTLCMAAGLAACGGSSSTAATTAEQSNAETTTAQADSDFEEQIFECDTIMITVTGMSMITEGSFAGRVGVDLIVENLTNIDLKLPAFTEIGADKELTIPGYPMGGKSGDTLVLAEDGTGEFSHEWDIEDASGEVIDFLSIELTVSKDLMDQSQDSGINYQSAQEDVPESFEDTVIAEDDWVKITFADISCSPASLGGAILDGTLNVENTSGKSLLIASEARMSDGAGGVFRETDEEDFPASGISVRTSTSSPSDYSVKEYTVYVFDPDNASEYDHDQYGSYYYRQGRVYNITVSVEGGELTTEYTMEETEEFAYMLYI